MDRNQYLYVILTVGSLQWNLLKITRETVQKKSSKASWHFFPLKSIIFVGKGKEFLELFLHFFVQGLRLYSIQLCLFSEISNICQGGCQIFSST